MVASRLYLVAATEASGIDDAAQRGWHRIARSRFVTPERDDVLLVWRFPDMLPIGSVTRMIKGADYDSGPDDAVKLAAWIEHKEQFDRFVAFHRGEWVEP